MIKILVNSKDSGKSFEINLNIDNDGIQTVACCLNSTEMLKRVELLQKGIPFAKVEINISGGN